VQLQLVIDVSGENSFSISSFEKNVWTVGGEEAVRHVVDPNYVNRGGGIRFASLYLASPIS
jgi:hypothetical protein